MPPNASPSSLDLPHLFGGAWAALLALSSSIPDHWERAGWAILVMLLVDYISGVAVALRAREYRSSTARDMMGKKFLQILLIGGFFGALWLLTSVEACGWAAIFVVLSIETSSVHENLCKLEVLGVPFGPMGQVLRRTARYFASVQEMALRAALPSPTDPPGPPGAGGGSSASSSTSSSSNTGQTGMLQPQPKDGQILTSSDTIPTIPGHPYPPPDDTKGT